MSVERKKVTDVGISIPQLRATIKGRVITPDDAATHKAWVSGFAAALPQGEPGVYGNFLGDEGEARIREAYPRATWERLRAIKGRYDPTNLFRLNQNIPPASDASPAQ